MTAPVLWIWDKNDVLLYEGQFTGTVMKKGRAYRYKHLCHDGTREGLVVSKTQIKNAIVLDDVDFEEEGILTVSFN